MRTEKTKCGKTWFYGDSTNFWVTGTYQAAVVKGLANDIWDAHARRTNDRGWRYDMKGLYDFIFGGMRSWREIGRATLYGSPSSTNGILWKIAKANGFSVVLGTKNAGGREKGVDARLMLDMMTDAVNGIDTENDEVILLSGDEDFVPVVEKLVGMGIPVTVIFWTNAAKGLREAASRFVPLDPFFDVLTLKSTLAVSAAA